MALHNQPTMVPAALLKEKILRQREWDDDSSDERTFLHQLIEKERGYTGGLLGRPARSAPATLLDEDEPKSTDTEP